MQEDATTHAPFFLDPGRRVAQATAKQHIAGRGPIHGAQFVFELPMPSLVERFHHRVLVLRVNGAGTVALA